MARQREKLTSPTVSNASAPGLYGDGGGLYLNVGPAGTKSWIFRYMLNRKAREMGLGPYPDVSLAKAREKARKAREQKADGIDPVAHKKAERARKAAEAAAAITFKEAAQRYIKAHRAGWRNAKHADQWQSTLQTYAYPVIGAASVGMVSTGDVTRVLEEIWITKPETASRVRGRIEAVLSYATALGWRTGDNPARWRGHLQKLLAKRTKVRKVVHHAALPWKQIADFMADLAQQEGVAALALRFAILTAARTGEVIGARWSEIDMQAAVWTLAEHRMKSDRQHRVPLSGAALDVLQEAEQLRERKDADGFVFSGQKHGRGLSNMALLMMLRRMGRDDLTAHGFRSTFRDWAAETGWPADIAEAALAHVVGDKTVAAYQRGDLLERRRRLMNEWAMFCSRPPGDGTVVPRQGAIA